MYLTLCYLRHVTIFLILDFMFHSFKNSFLYCLLLACLELCFQNRCFSICPGCFCRNTWFHLPVDPCCLSSTSFFFLHNYSHIFALFPCHLGVLLKPISIWLIIFYAVSIPLLTVSMHFNLLYFLNYFLLSQYDILLAYTFPLASSSFISCLLPYPSALPHSQSPFLSPSDPPFLSLPFFCVCESFFFFNNYLFLPVLGLCCCLGSSQVVGSRSYSPVVGHGLLIAVASLVGHHGLQSMPVSAAAARGL